MNEPLAPATILIVVITAIVSFRGFGNRRFLERFLFDPQAILRDREHYRLVTSAFLHADMFHLFFNVFSLYSFGSGIELVFGLRDLLLIYFGSILGGSVLSLWLHRHHEYRALGASGGVCGVIFASIFLMPGGSVVIFPVPVPLPAWLFAIVFLVVSFIGLRRQLGNVGHDAHLGGAIIGLLLTTALHPRIVPASPRLFAAVMLLSAALFVYLWLNPLLLPPRSLLARWREWRAARRTRPREMSLADAHAELDRLLDKIARSGMDSLTAAERQRLRSLAARTKRAGTHPR